MSTILLFKNIESKHDVYRDEDCMSDCMISYKFCESLREHAMNISNFKKKKMKLLTNEQQKHFKTKKPVILAKKNLKINIIQIVNIVKLGTIVIIQENIEMMRITYVI